MVALLVALLVAGCGTSSDPAVPFAPPPEGATWFVETDSGRWLTPEGAEPYLTLAPDGLALWLHASEVTETEMSFRLAVGDEKAQDTCVRTIEMMGLGLDSEGRFRFGPADFALPNGLAAAALVLEGRFSTDGSQILELSATALVDLSSIPDDLIPALDVDDRCKVISALLDAECLPCRDGREFCLTVELADFVGETRPQNSTQVIPLADCHPGCELSEENSDCDRSGW